MDPAVITRAARDGRLVRAPDGDGYLANESVARYHATEDKGARGEAQRDRWQHAKSAAGAPEESQPPRDGTPGDEAMGRQRAESDRGADALAGLRFRIARADKAAHEAEIARMTRERMEGELAETASIRDGAQRLGIALRTRFESLPDQLSPLLAAETDRERVHALLVEAIEQALRQTARELADWAQQLRAEKG